MTATYNPLTGWVENDGSLMGWGGGNGRDSGQERTGGMAAGQDNGYNGKVDNWSDFGKALGWGVGSVFGGPVASALGIGNLVVGANTGTTPSTLNTLQQAAQSLGLMNAGPSVSGTVSNDLTAGNFGGKTGEATSSLGAERGGASFEGPDIGAQGDRTAEARSGWAQGGFTGGAEGQPRGEVHGQELVLSAPAVRALGPVANQLETVNALVSRRKGLPQSWEDLIAQNHPGVWG